MVEQVQKPLLIDSLTLPEKVMLGQTSLTPGYQVLVKMIEAGCSKATEDTIKADPEDVNYDQILKARQQYSRAVNRFSTLLLKSVEYHTEHGIAEEQQKEQESLQEVQQDR
jgi:hypothetical protein